MKFSLLILIISALGALFMVFACQPAKEKKKSTSESELGFKIDGDTIRYYDEILTDIDAQSFAVIDDYFCKDKDQVYYFNSYRESSTYFLTKKHVVRKLESADAGSFVSLGEGYAKDNQQAWYNDQRFRVKDLNSLTVLNHHFIKDNISAYNDRKAITGSHGATFELIDSYYAKDSLHYYFLNPEGGDFSVYNLPCDYSTFTPLVYPYSKDKSNVFYRNEIIQGATPQHFIITGHPYSRDSRFVYYRTKKITGADPESFTLFKENESSMGEMVYAKDKNGIYCNEQLFAAADIPSFRILNEKYTIDKNGVYYKMKRMPNADAATFKVYPHFLGDADAEDKNHKFGEGKEVE
jgi:DKNYY family